RVPARTCGRDPRRGRGMTTADIVLYVVLGLVILFTITTVAKAIRIVPQATAVLVESLDTVIYFQPTDPKSAVYEIANYIQGIEQLTVTTLRNVIGSLDLEQTL